MTHPPGPAHVVSVSRDDAHRFSKPVVEEIRLVEGFGVEGDAHAGATVTHRYQVRKTPGRPNLRQVHLLAAELFGEVATLGYTVAPGQMGENVTTSAVDLLSLPTGTVLRLGAEASVRLTGLRTPCRQINGLAPGLMQTLIGRDAEGAVVRRAGVMAVVVTGGVIRPGDLIGVDLPVGPHQPLQPV
jgi:MOSC domain-containing protein YiiM